MIADNDVLLITTDHINQICQWQAHLALTLGFHLQLAHRLDIPERFECEFIGTPLCYLATIDASIYEPPTKLVGCALRTLVGVV